MNYSLYLDGVPTEELPSIAARADSAGFRDLLKAETIYGDAMSACAAMAMATQTLRVGSGIAGVYGRSALVFAMTAAALARLSAGRFILGLGLQSPRYVETWHGARYEGMRGFRERLGIIRSLLAGKSVNGYHLAFPPPAAVPIYTAALGPKMIELAGELADGLLGYFYTRAYVEQVVRPHIAMGTRR